MQPTVRLSVTLALLAAVVLPLSAAGKEEPTHPAESWRRKQQPLFDRINLAEAWKVTKGDPKVLVGVIDNGFDFYHPDLKGQLIPGYYYPGGYHTEFFENMAHGTLVSSIIVAREGNPDGMVGLAPRCKVLTASQGMIEHGLYKMEQRFFHDHPKASLADFQKDQFKHLPELAKFGTSWVHYQVANAADAIRYLVDHGVKVINFSGGLKKSLTLSSADWKKLEEAFAYAAAKGVVIVLAAGNNAERWEDYPGKPDTMIVAGACLLNDNRWEQEVTYRGTKVKQGSNYGKRLTVMAPVENLVVCQPHERRVYDIDDGPMGAIKEKYKGGHDVLHIGATSCAAPVVTSLVALVYSVRPDLDARAVVEIVKQGCDDIGPKGYDVYTGYGRVNFGKSVRLAQRWGRK